MSELVKYTCDSREIQLSPRIIREYLVTGEAEVTDKEVMLFLELCKHQKLNPFLREAYLIKYKTKDGKGKANMVTGKEVFTKRASKNPMCDGWKSGIAITNKNGDLSYREGTLLLSTEKLVGGWCEVKRKDWSLSQRSEVSLSEYNTHQSLWNSKPAVMIQKVAIVTALRNMFPEDFVGLYSPEEMPVDIEKLNTDPVDITAPAKKVVEAEVVDVAVVEEPPIMKDYPRITEKQRSFLFAKHKEMGVAPEELKKKILEFGYTTTKDISKHDFQAILDWVEGKVEAAGFTDVLEPYPDEAMETKLV